ncbi:MAG: hypothetical protein KatS3mg111_3067 [Pirellulaceae bacterium]|nr:MAG: hypothetical protein KatS3mg111_3067 [Pirellulaceae bacterium]
MNRKRYEWLEVGRGIAAIWVVLHHCDQSFNAFMAAPGNRPSLLVNGYLGVDFFFILSGFIIAYSTQQLQSRGGGGGGGVKQYALSRITRIYIPYLPIGLDDASFLFFVSSR